MTEQAPPTSSRSRVVSTLLAAWLLALAFDFLLHGGVLARLYTRPDPFLLAPIEAFRRIPAGYLAFLLLTAGLYWLLARLAISGWFDGLRLGFFAGLLVWGAMALGLYSISTAPIDMLLGWWIGQAFELALSGAVIGSSLAGKPLKPIWLKVAVAVVTLGVGTVLLQTIGWAQSDTPQPDRSNVYREADGQALSAYVFLPSSRKAGAQADAILLFHGGGWNAGTPEWTFPAAQRFADWGLVAISIQYRLSGGEVTPIEALADVCASLGWVRDQADELGLSGRLLGYGVSAGAHLITATATIGCPDAEAGPDALLLWSPALDVTTDGWFSKQLQGRATATAYSPVQKVGPSTPPTSIVIGAEDTLTPLSGARRYCERLIQQGKICELNVYEGLGHLLTRNLANQESDFDPDPKARADGIEQHRGFLRRLGFVTEPKAVR